MAVNFRISQLKCKNSIHLTLNGDFDGTSAHELINTLKSCSSEVDQVFINTNGLKTIHNFGRIVLSHHISGVVGSLVFIGNHGRRLAKPWIH